MDLIAKAARVSRSTLYRRFSNKDALLAALLEEVQYRIQSRLIEVIHGRDHEGAIVESFVEAVGLLRRDRLLRRLHESEPESVQQIALSGGRGTIATQAFAQYSMAVARTLRKAGAKMPEPDLLVASELLIRITVSYVDTASTFVDIDESERARDFATKFLVPLIW
jgi:AcrR family transcriptional regulator